MSGEQKITVELTEADARDLASASWLNDTPGGRLRAAIHEALPPAGYVRGALYRVDGSVGFFDGLAFVFSSDTRGNSSIAGYSRREPHQVSKVEPLRVLADDEIAVKRSTHDGCAYWRGIAERVRHSGYGLAAARVDAYADALEAEAKS